MSRTASIINSLNFVKQMLLLVQKVDIQLVPCLPPLFLLSLSSCPITYGVWSCGSGGRGPGPMDHSPMDHSPMETGVSIGEWLAVEVYVPWWL